MYLFLPVADGTFNVGFYAPSGRWVTESNHPDSDSAVSRMRFLNGAPFDDTQSPPPPPAPGPNAAHPQEKKR